MSVLQSFFLRFCPWRDSVIDGETLSFMVLDKGKPSSMVDIKDTKGYFQAAFVSRPCCSSILLGSGEFVEQYDLAQAIIPHPGDMLSMYFVSKCKNKNVSFNPID